MVHSVEDKWGPFIEMSLLEVEHVFICLRNESSCPLLAGDLIWPGDVDLVPTGQSIRSCAERSRARAAP